MHSIIENLNQSGVGSYGRLEAAGGLKWPFTKPGLIGDNI
jgi:hypothetical protein